MLACDFVTVACAVTVRRVYVFFVPEVSTRQVHVRGVTPYPDGSGTMQQAPAPADGQGERATRFRFLARDRAGQFTDAFDAVLPAAGTEVVKIPPRSPRANAYAQRRVRTARAEVTDRMLICGQRHLRAIRDEHVAHDNQHRPHRARISGHRTAPRPSRRRSPTWRQRRHGAGSPRRPDTRVPAGRMTVTGPAITLQVKRG